MFKTPVPLLVEVYPKTTFAVNPQSVIYYSRPGFASSKWSGFNKIVSSRAGLPPTFERAAIDLCRAVGVRKSELDFNPTGRNP
jgi:hypothetical protein